MENKKFKGKIISALRRLTYTWPPRNARLADAKVDKALFQCELCCTLCYNGKSEANLLKLQEKYPDRKVVLRKIHVDHIDTMVPIIKGWVWNWDDVIHNLFCEEHLLQAICSVCHDAKTSEEKERRKLLRKKS